MHVLICSCALQFAFLETNTVSLFSLCIPLQPCAGDTDLAPYVHVFARGSLPETFTELDMGAASKYT